MGGEERKEGREGGSNAETRTVGSEGKGEEEKLRKGINMEAKLKDRKGRKKMEQHKEQKREAI